MEVCDRRFTISFCVSIENDCDEEDRTSIQLPVTPKMSFIAS